MRAHLTVVGQSCPVCGSEAQRGQDTRDVVNIRCRRCGPFTISGTALAMLTSYLEADERSRACVSHAIRSATSEERRLEIDSTNIDKLVNSALPRAGQQIDNFLKWISVELGDDQMGLVQLPENLDDLSGVVGTVDGERIEALVSEMQKEGLIERPSDNHVRLTMAAWNRLGQSPRETETIEISAYACDYSADMAYLVNDRFGCNGGVASACCSTRASGKENKGPGTATPRKAEEMIWRPLHSSCSREPARS